MEIAESLGETGEEEDRKAAEHDVERVRPKRKVLGIRAYDRGVGERAPANLAGGLLHHSRGEIDADKKARRTNSLSRSEKNGAPPRSDVEDVRTSTHTD